MAKNRQTARAMAPKQGGSLMPESPELMLCTLVAQPFDDPAWLFEPKFDGLRLLVRFDGQHLSLLSRNAKEQAVAFPDLAEALRAALTKPAIVDGEAVCFDAHGHTSFRTLQQRFHLTQSAEIEARKDRFPASIYLFDILYLDGRDLRELPLTERKAILRRSVRWSDRVRWTEGHPEQGIALLRQACREGQEGIIGKRIDSPYEGRRSRAWVKVKCLNRQEFVIVGYTEPRSSRVGLGSLLLGYYDDDGKTLLYAGKVGTGFAHETLIDLRRRFSALEQPHSPFARGKSLSEAGVHWVRPKLVAEVAFAEWTQHSLLRQPRFEGLRPDKEPRDCRRERPQTGAAWTAIVHKKPARSSRKRK